MKDIKTKILSNKEIAPGYFKMALDAPYIAKNARPGQFVQLRCSDGFDPFLRRPFSIHRVKGEGLRVKEVEILYEIIGKGTEILSRKKAGETIDILGPLGNGFTLPPSTLHPPPSTLIVAGGIGVAPLIFLAEKLMEIRNPTLRQAQGRPEQCQGAKSEIRITVLLGARTKKVILCAEDFKKLGTKVQIATDDGSHGYKGLVTDLFKKTLCAMPALSGVEGRHACPERSRRAPCAVYACGPRVMLECIADMCVKKDVECEVSLEEKMACGIGACLGCAVRVKGEGSRVEDSYRYKLACKDGPVFKANKIIGRQV